MCQRGEHTLGLHLAQLPPDPDAGTGPVDLPGAARAGDTQQQLRRTTAQPSRVHRDLSNGVQSARGGRCHRRPLTVLTRRAAAPVQLLIGSSQRIRQQA